VHELKTPLTSIIATVDLLQEQVKDPLQTRMVQNILRSSVNLEQRVNELFELARGELGLIKIEPVPLDMGRLIIEIAAEITPVAQEKGLKLRTEIPAAALTVGRQKPLRQVLINLLGIQSSSHPGRDYHQV
jgi:signal transduction histidine kinase